jgi:tRNA nucleotidyltransferase/poly(A) polymerase
LLTRHKFHIRPNYLGKLLLNILTFLNKFVHSFAVELKSRLSDLFCKIERNNETYHLENVNQRSRSQCDNGLTKLKNSVTSFNDFSNKQDFSSLSLRKVTLRQILKIWEKTRRGKSLQASVIDL